jgi:hypothetical protein
MHDLSLDVGVFCVPGKVPFFQALLFSLQASPRLTAKSPSGHSAGSSGRWKANSTSLLYLHGEDFSSTPGQTFTSDAETCSSVALECIGAIPLFRVI